MTCILPAGNTAALTYAAEALKQQGIYIADHPSNAVTHLLLPVPTFRPDGSIPGIDDFPKLLAQLPQNVVVIGGNLTHPMLQNHQVVDLLQNETYLAANAAITAHCAIKQALIRLPVTLDGQNILVLGWGRIGKSLARLLQDLGANVTVAARKAADRAILQALGYHAVSTEKLSTASYRVIFNTVPMMLLPECPGNALKIELASKPGIGGSDVVSAKGLPNLDAPESSGRLIAKTVFSMLRSKEVSI